MKGLFTNFTTERDLREHVKAFKYLSKQVKTSAA